MKEEKDKVNTEELEDQAEASSQGKQDAESEKEEEAKNEEPTLENQLGEAKDKYLRLYSEFENFRRRTAKERLDLISTANRDLMTELLPVIDDFERAMTASTENKDEKAFKEGVELIQNKFNKTLESKGLKKMAVKKGDKFDDEKHEAITQIPAEKKFAGKVVDVIEAGYYLGETVVRFAKVVVGAKQ
ncbi:MAG: nucleotide exchange factor GrpE [Cyclobacteriaceae bacterium]